MTTTAHPVHRLTFSPRGRARTAAGAAIVAAAVVTSSFLIATPASAAPVSTAHGAFLTGSALGIPLSGLLAVTDASASNTGATSTTTDLNPLLAAALNTGATVGLGNSVNLLGTNGILTVGAVNQYAQAKSDGSSTAASGAVTDAGAIGVPGSGGVPASDATIALGPLITGNLTTALSDANLAVGAVSATASQAPGAGGAQSGTYRIASLKLNLTSPLVSGVRSGLVTTVSGLQPTVNAIPATVNGLLGPLATVTGIPNVGTIVANSLSSVTSADGSIIANLRTGAVSIDVAKVLTTAGLDINALPANTDLLPYITAALTSQLVPAITIALAGTVTALTDAISGITIRVAGVPVSLAIAGSILNPVIATVIAPVNAASAGLVTTVATPLASALSTLISLRANVQSTSAGVFTERALTVGLLPSAAPPAAIINLANASVGPNAGPIPTASGLTPSHGPLAGGTAVTITGTNFTPGSTVSIDGGAPIVPTSIAADGASLVLLTPAHAVGPVDVTVTNASGTTPPRVFTYDPIPVTTSLTPNHGPIAGGTAVTVTGTGFTSTTTVSVDGSAPITPSSIAPNGLSLVFTTPAHTVGPVGVTVTTAGGTSAARTYTYDPLPTQSSLSPNHGPVAGGTVVTVTGTGFAPGSTVSVDGGPAITPDSIAGNGLSLTFTTPSHAVGPVPVTVTTPAGTTAPRQFTFDAAPVATSISPTHGPVAGGTAVTVTGSGFIPGTTVSVDGGAAIVPDSIAADGLSLVFTTPAHTAGTVPVIVSNTGGTAAAVPFTFDAAPIPAPTITGLAPDFGPTAGGTTVTVTGTDFIAGSTVSIDGGTPIVPDSIAANGMSLTFTTPAHTAGDVTVTVSTASGTSNGDTFTFGAPPAQAPTSLSLAPDHGPVAGGTAVAISGTNFTSGSTVSIDGGAAITPTSIAADGTSLVFSTPAHPAGPIAVTVTTAAGTTAALGFTFDPAPVPAPTAVSLAPDNGTVAGGTTVTVVGSDFTPASTVTIGGVTVTPTSVATNGNSLVFETPAHPAGGVSVTVTTASGTTAPLTYTYTPLPVPEPTAISLTPDHGPQAGGTAVTITGTDFTPDSLVAIDGGAAIIPLSIAADGESLVFATPAHLPGDVAVTVTTATGTSDPLDFTFDPAPTALSLSPGHGPLTGGTVVTVLGTGFTPGSVVLIDGAITVAPDAVAADGSSLAFTTPAHAAGPVDVAVRTAAGTTVALPFVFDAAPVVSSLNPTHGPAAGETSVTVTGTGFTASTRVSVDGGAAITPDSIASDGLSFTFTTPAHEAGPVPVVVSTAAGTASPQQYTYDAAPVPAPTATALAPDNGPAAGGTTVTITGTDFSPGSIVTIGGVPVTPTTIAANGQSLTFETPAHAPGPVAVSVTTPTGTTGDLEFTYGPAPVGSPTSTSLTPDHGPVAGGTLVTITGTNFTGAATVSVDGSAPIAPENVAADGESLTFRTPAHPSGPVPVTVTTATGTTAALAFTFDPAPVPAPTTTAIAPNHGPAAGETSVTITGTGFTAASTVTVDGMGGIVPDSIASNGNSLVFTTPAHTAGTVPVSVTTASGTSAPLSFTFDAAPVPAPTATGLAPDNGPAAGGTSVTVTGTNFVPGSTVTVDGGTAIIPTSIAADGKSLVFETSPHASGTVPVVVTTPSGSTAPLDYTYGAVALSPTATALSPDHGPVAGGTSVTITGSNFTSGSTVSVDGGAPIAPDSVAGNGNSLTFTTPGHAVGTVPVSVTTAIGTTAALPFEYEPAAPATPTATGIAPNHGPTAGGTSVTVTGTGFTAGSTVSIGGTTVTPTSIAGNGNSLTFESPAHAAGTVSVRVTTAGGTTGPQDFTYDAPVIPAPTALSLTPTSGSTAGGESVTITGTGFTPTTTVSINNGAPIPANGVSADGTSLTFTTPAHSAGDVTVRVTSPSGTSGGLIFTFVAPPVPVPTVSGLTPTHGPATGGTTVTITGTGFADDAVVSIDGGTPIAPDSIAADGTFLTFSTPAHSAGSVAVTVSTSAGTSPSLTYTFDSAPAQAAPQLDGLAPGHGPTSGNTTVTVSGSGFTPDALISIDGGTPFAPDTIAGNGNSLTFSTPAHSAGGVDVTVVTAAGESDPLPFVYDAPAAPTIGTLTPNSGPVAGGTTVTITGSGFAAGSTVSVDGVAVVPGSIAANGQSLQFTTPAHAAGPAVVSVTTPTGTTSPRTFTYIAAPVGAPTATGLAPDNGPVDGGTPVTITGTGFTPDSSVTIDGVVVTPDSIAGNGNSLVFTTPAHAAGAVIVTVTTAAGTTGGLQFTFGDPTPTTPTAASLTPDHGPAAGGDTVTVTGTNFTPDSTVTVDGVEINPDSVSGDGTELTFTTPAHAPGQVPVVVQTPDGSTAALEYTYDAAPAVAPVISGLAPNHGPVAGGQSVTITGTGFTAGSTVTINGGAALAPTSVAANGLSLVFVTPAHAAGPVAVRVTTGAGTSGPATYTFDPAPVPVPTITGISPNHGPEAGNTVVTITGTGFTVGSVISIDGGTAFPISGVSADGTSLTFVTPAHDPGPVTVRVIATSGQSNGRSFTYDSALVAPVIDGLSPDHGPAGGGTEVTITGSGFTAGSTVSIDGGPAIVPTSISADGTSLVFITPVHDEGVGDVTVTSPGGESDPTEYTFDPDNAATLPDPVILTPTDGGTVSTGTPLISGTGTAGDELVVEVDGNIVCTVTVQPDSSWTCTPDDALGDGAHVIVVTETAPDGTTATATVDFTVALPDDGNGGNNGGGNNGGNGGNGGGNNGGGTVDPTDLASTGLEIGLPIAISLNLIGGGVLLLIALAWRRRRRA